MPHHPDTAVIVLVLLGLAAGLFAALIARGYVRARRHTARLRRYQEPDADPNREESDS